MTENQRIHPVVDMEAPPPTRTTRPLVPRGSFKSEKGDPTRLFQQPTVNQPVRRTTPVMYSRPPTKKRSCICKCICWTISLIILLLIIIAAIAGILYLVFKPKIPQYSVDNLRISDLRLNFDMSLYARFNVRITAVNPNKKIGIYYEKGSHLSVWYKNTQLCKGSLPKFYQGHQNRTVLDVALTGQSEYGNTLMSAIQEAAQTGRIPLDLKIQVPVSVKLGRLKLRKVKILGDCLLIVDSLSANSLVRIKASTCKFGLKL
ncbi:NDR1/HIN1-like protein 6 [Solanum lycopersicum]|uniref:NDR1/HIN1-like protein 6 n=1 Tax=Solanum lycopersicum TaxID=4081 RepID=UPI0002BC9512|nr:NDR1/HIN1-like protein 6 [Solanum lycopersicum]